MKRNTEKYGKAISRTVCEFLYGLDDAAGEYADGGAILADCVNMQYDEGKLMTRKGFRAVAGSLVSPEQYDRTVYMPFKVTDAACYVNGERRNIAYICMGDDSYANIRIYLTDRDGNITPAGNIRFNRMSEEVFYIPENIFFVTAQKSASGGGVYAFVALNSGGGKRYDVYEANGALTSWTNANGNIYVPTVRINGRGERYDSASSLGGFTYPEPARPEKLNVLTGKFKCYFTADGLSSIFRLPYGNLSDVLALGCRVYTSSETYVEWTVPGNATHSSATILGQTVYLYVDRTLGIIRFWDGNADYCVPQMDGCKLNNIMVTAVTSDSGDPGEIVSSKGTAALDGRFYVYGNSVKQNCIYCAKQTQPLYFPEDSKLYLGDGGTPVTSLKVQNGKIIAFKPGETYRVVTSFEDETPEREAVLPESTMYITGDKLSAKTIDTNIGCACPETIRLCGSRNVWMGGDGGIYALATTTYGNTTNVYRVSQPISGRLKAALKNAGKVFALTQDGYYILIVDDTAFVMNYKVRGFGFSKSYYAGDDEKKSPAWYIWKLSSVAAIDGGAGTDGGAVMFGSLSDGVYGYTAVITGAADSTLAVTGGVAAVTERPIEAEFKTKLIDCDAPEQLKAIDCMFANGKGAEPVTLTLSDGEKTVNRRVNLANIIDTFCMTPGFPPCRGFSVGMRSKQPFSVRSVVVRYRPISRIG